MFKYLIGAVVVAMTAGCATVSHTPLSPEASQQLNGKSVSPTQYPMPDFAAFTAGKAAFAMVGVVAMISEGNSIVRENEIPDPAVKISQGLVDRLVAARQTSIVPSNGPLASDDLDAIISASPSANYIVDVKTFNWLFTYYPSDWFHYRVLYNARLRLIDTKANKVIAETMCKTVQGDDKNPPTKDQLLDNKAALLKEYLDKGAAACIDVLAKTILQI